MMGEWQLSTLKEIAHVNPTERLEQGKPAKKIAMEYLAPFTKRLIGFEISNFKGGTKFRNSDTLVARITPCLENGKTAYVDILDEGEVAFGSTEYIVLREKAGLSDKQFLYYFATNNEFRDVAILSMTGSSGRQRVQTDVVLSHEFVFPPLPEQKAIAEVLSSLDDKIDLLHRQNKTLESLAETLFRQYFIENAQDDWEVLQVRDIATHLKSSVKPQSFQLKTYYHYSLPAFDSGERPLQELGDAILSNKYKVVENSILVSKLNPKFPRIWAIGEGIHENSICSTEFQVFQPKNNEIYGFLLSLFKSEDARQTLEASASGTSGSHQRVTPDDILNIEFAIPFEKAMTEFSNIVDASIKKTWKNKAEIQSLEKLRDTLLPKLMNGEIRISKSEEECQI